MFHALIPHFIDLGFAAPWRSGRWFVEVILPIIDPWRSG